MSANSHAVNLVAASSQYLSIADGSQTGLDLSGNFTMSGWFRTTNNTLSQAIIVKGNYNTTSRAYSLIYRNSNNLEIAVSDDGTNPEYRNYSWTPTNNVWYHLAVTCDISAAVATEFEYFVNGSSVGNGSAGADDSATTISNSADPFQIGGQEGASNPENPMSGLLDEIVVTSDILTAPEISKLYEGYDATKIGLDNLQGYWKLNNALTDSSGNGNTLTNNGIATFSSTVPFVNYKGDSGFFALL